MSSRLGGDKGISPGVGGEGWDDTTPGYEPRDAAELLFNPDAARNMEPMTKAEVQAGADYIRRNFDDTEERIAAMVARAWVKD